MSRNPTMPFKPWTQDEAITLKHLLAEGTPPRAIARQLNRTLEALHHIMSVEKLTHEDRSTP